MSGFSPSYVVDCIAESVHAEVRLNDWALFRSEGRQTHSLSARVNAFALESGNVVSASLRPWDGPTPSTPRFQLSVYRMLANDQIWPIAQFRYQPRLHPLQPDGFVEVFRHESLFADSFGTWLWESARPYQDADRPALVEGVRELHAALEQADGARFVELFSTKLGELARSQGKRPDGVIANQKTWLSELFKMDKLRVEPLDPDNLRLESMCQGRVVDVRAADGQAPLRAWLGGDRLHFDVMMTRQGERWVAIR